jgi:hypothetical protein
MSAELVGLDQLTDHRHRRAVQKRVAGHEISPAPRRAGRAFRLVDGAASGFSTKTCFPASSAADASAK